MTSSLELTSLVDGKLLLGNQTHAQYLNQLESLQVTHILACGFQKGFHESVGKFKYLCIDIQDIPNENILRYLPKAMLFIESCVSSQNNNNNNCVLVHCVHGQSRSCAICIAYLMLLYIRSPPSEYIPYEDLLTTCHSKLLQVRPCMAINPGFIRQLEIFRRMHCGIYKEQIRPSSYYYQNEQDKSEVKKCYPPQSRAYATFRSFRLKTEYSNGNISQSIFTKFHPSLPQNKEYLASLVVQICKYDEGTTSSSRNFYRCKKCRYLLFSDWNIPYWHNTLDRISKLPSSPYWEESEGGKQFLFQFSKTKKQPQRKDNGIMAYSILPTTHYPLEPMEWMKSSIMSSDLDQNSCNGNQQIVSNKGKLTCPNCRFKIGLWDWNYCDNFVYIFACKSSFDSFTINVPS